MKIKKNYFSLMFGKYKMYTLPDIEDKNFINSIRFLFELFGKKYIYLRVNIKHKNLFLTNCESYTVLDNDIIIRYGDLSFLNIIDSHLNDFHYVFIYSHDELLEIDSKKKIKQILYNMSFNISFDENHEIEFCINYKDYEKETINNNLKLIMSK